MSHKIPISDFATKRNWNQRPGIRESWEGFEEWFCAIVCAAGLWFVAWVIWQAWRLFR